jgi:hypothetical protein
MLQVHVSGNITCDMNDKVDVFCITFSKLYKYILQFMGFVLRVQVVLFIFPRFSSTHTHTHIYINNTVLMAQYRR